MLKIIKYFILFLLFTCNIIYAENIKNNDDATYLYQYLCGLEVTFEGASPYDPKTSPAIVSAYSIVPYKPMPELSEQLNSDLALMFKGELKSKSDRVDNTSLLENLLKGYEDLDYHEKLSKLRQLLKPVEKELEKAVCKGSRWSNFSFDIFYFRPYPHNMFNYNKAFMNRIIFTCGNTKVDIRDTTNGIVNFMPSPNLRRMVHVILNNGKDTEDFFLFDELAAPLLFANCYVNKENSWLELATSYSPWNDSNGEPFEMQVSKRHYFFNTQYLATVDTEARYYFRMPPPIYLNELGVNIIDHERKFSQYLEPFENIGMKIDKQKIIRIPCNLQKGALKPHFTIHENETMLKPIPNKANK